ncbi:MAG: hypothetical protein ACJ8ER_09885 [Allosphingosinicella sp.]
MTRLPPQLAGFVAAALLLVSGVGLAAAKGGSPLTTAIAPFGCGA